MFSITATFSRNNRFALKFIMLIATLLLANCATKPTPEVILTSPNNDIDLAEVSKDLERFNGTQVRWGGRIIKTRVQQEQLVIDVLQYPLSQKGKPISEESAGGRFAIVIEPPFDKKYFYRNRYITVFGKIDGEVVYPLAQGEQKLPRVIAQEHYTWNRQYEDRSSNFWPWFGVQWHRGGGFGGGIIFQY